MDGGVEVLTVAQDAAQDAAQDVAKDSRRTWRRTWCTRLPGVPRKSHLMFILSKGAA